MYMAKIIKSGFFELLSMRRHEVAFWQLYYHARKSNVYRHVEYKIIVSLMTRTIKIQQNFGVTQ